ncbi:hypothetical protein HFN89_04620 [Rhizobium laguerreae]|nr:hypothetical protein [Rhizobium laguerreae]
MTEVNIAKSAPEGADQPRKPNGIAEAFGIVVVIVMLLVGATLASVSDTHRAAQIERPQGAARLAIPLAMPNVAVKAEATSIGKPVADIPVIGPQAATPDIPGDAKEVGDLEHRLAVLKLHLEIARVARELYFTLKYAPENPGP